MRVAVTGTPGTGKTTATDRLDTDLDVIHLNDTILETGLTAGEDPDRDTTIADVDAVAEWLAGRDDVLFESHLAHRFPADHVIVLRAHPAEIERRLRERGEADAKVTENAESEALDVILARAVEEQGEDSVYEVDTTDRNPEDVAEEIESVLAGSREPSAGTVSFIDWL